MYLIVMNPTEYVYQDEAYSISARALDGEIVFQDQHENYLTALNEGEIIVKKLKTDVEVHRIPVKDHSILLIQNNKALIFNNYNVGIFYRHWFYLNPMLIILYVYSFVIH